MSSSGRSILEKILDGRTLLRDETYSPNGFFYDIVARVSRVEVGNRNSLSYKARGAINEDKESDETHSEATRLLQSAISTAHSTAFSSEFTCVSLTWISAIDLGRPDAEHPGTPFLFIRNVSDTLARALNGDHDVHGAVRDLENAWMQLSRLCGLQVTAISHIMPIGLSITSVMCVAAAASGHYRNAHVTDALLVYVAAAYRDREIRTKLRCLDEILTKLVMTRVFPHAMLFPAGSLLRATESERIAKYTLLQRGNHEIAGYADLHNVRIPAFHIPACIFLDLDDTLYANTGHNSEGVFFVYVVFIYDQNPDNVGYELYIAKSIFDEYAIRDVLTRKFIRRSVTNITYGHENVAAIRRHLEELPAFCLDRLAREATRDPSNRSRSVLEPPRDDRRLARMQIDPIGKPTRDTALFGAYALLGVCDSDYCRPEFYTEKCHGAELRFVKLPGMNHLDGVWHTCA
ncbi:capsid triplex subunit 1 [Psittacid alphaherpesvirus 5]|uniref:Capsid triplex subunit 1 n=1 Tax=Psittacid alphaherpesvirus 5 TaxID=2972693 RepID=A0A5P9JTI9_9ALPH|nr:capsid triplex subunit 1 [Psittacid alphaherpesvirus 5]QFU14575.1 capsid triplex subunit 1 [Psittacid alphaherpesvirus 5]UOO01046.1 capsid triplex subunit 1 [Psittacid alphaherpesvirus 5]